MATPTLIVFLGGLGASATEKLVDEARLKATRAALAAWERLGISRPVLVSDRAIAGENFALDLDEGDFHLGRRLAGVLRKHGVASAIYMGGGSMPLFGSGDFADLVARMESSEVVTNNNFSSDLVAFPVNETALAAVEPVARDNSLARALLDAGLQSKTLPRTAATLFDIDTPTDVAVLEITQESWRDYLQPASQFQPLLARYRSVLPLFLERTKQIVVAGRVGSHAWRYLERATACRVRLFAEERGMEADNRAAVGAARSLLGYYYDAAGPERFFETLAELGDAAFIDTRVLLAHRRVTATREDRFLSDLGRWEDIGDSFLREFTRGAAEAAIPVLLGGHSLMSGGLMALNEYAWGLRDEGKL